MPEAELIFGDLDRLLCEVRFGALVGIEEARKFSHIFTMPQIDFRIRWIFDLTIEIETQVLVALKKIISSKTELIGEL